MAHRDVSLDGDGQGGVDGPHEADVSQGQDVGQHVDAVTDDRSFFKLNFELFSLLPVWTIRLHD